MVHCGTSAKTPFVLTPFGSRWSKFITNSCTRESGKRCLTQRSRSLAAAAAGGGDRQSDVAVRNTIMLHRGPICYYKSVTILLSLLSCYIVIIIILRNTIVLLHVGYQNVAQVGRWSTGKMGSQAPLMITIIIIMIMIIIRIMIMIMLMMMIIITSIIIISIINILVWPLLSLLPLLV